MEDFSNFLNVVATHRLNCGFRPADRELRDM